MGFPKPFDRIHQLVAFVRAAAFSWQSEMRYPISAEVVSYIHHMWQLIDYDLVEDRNKSTGNLASLP